MQKNTHEAVNYLNYAFTPNPETIKIPATAPKLIW